MASKRVNHSPEWQTKHEDLLIAIDQLEQLTEVMGEALTRVKQRVAILESTPDITNEDISRSKKSKPHIEVRAKKKGLVH